MIVTPHVVTGAAIGLAVHKPWLAFLLALVSHFALDVIPHWDPDIANPRSAFPVLLVDITLATLIFLSVLEMHEGVLIALVAGAFGGVLPDLIEIAWPRVHGGKAPYLTDFHVRIHSPKRPGPFPGLLIQAVFVAPILLWLFPS